MKINTILNFEEDYGLVYQIAKFAKEIETINQLSNIRNIYVLWSLLNNSNTPESVKNHINNKYPDIEMNVRNNMVDISYSIELKLGLDSENYPLRIIKEIVSGHFIDEKTIKNVIQSEDVFLIRELIKNKNVPVEFKEYIFDNRFKYGMGNEVIDEFVAIQLNASIIKKLILFALNEKDSTLLSQLLEQKELSTYDLKSIVEGLKKFHDKNQLRRMMLKIITHSKCDNEVLTIASKFL